MKHKNIFSLLLFSFIFHLAIGQVGVSTDDPQAALDIDSNNSGVLLPRIDLLSTTDVISVINPSGEDLVDGTMVWNTGVTGIQPSGFYFWQDGKWNLVSSNNEKTVHFGKMVISSSGSKAITGLGFTPSSIEFTAINRVQNYNDGVYRSGTNNSNDVRMAGGQMMGYATNYNGIKSQQVISIGMSGSSINNIGTYSSEAHCIAAYFVDSNGLAIHDNGQSNNGTDIQDGLIRASLTSFDNDGFTLNVDKFLAGAATNDRTNQIVVIFKAYR